MSSDGSLADQKGKKSSKDNIYNICAAIMQIINLIVCLKMSTNFIVLYFYFNICLFIWSHRCPILSLNSTG